MNSYPPHAQRYSSDAEDLQTGEYEAVPNEAPYGRAPQRAPVFYRSTALEAPHVVPQYGYQAQVQQGHVQQAYVQQAYVQQPYAPQAPAPQAFRQAPPAPNSLAPMAMNAPRNAASTGSNRAMETVLIRERPTVRSGMMILLVGVLAGGLVGVAMRAHRNALDAATATEAPVVAAVQAPPAAPPAPPPVMQPATPSVVPPAAHPSPPPAARPVVAAVVPTQPPIVVAPAPSKPEKHEAKAETKPDPKTDSKLEAKNEKVEKKHAPPPPAAPRPVVPAAAAATGGAHPRIATNVTVTPPKPEKPEKPVKGGKEKAPNDAVNILKAAMGETENTL